MDSATVANIDLRLDAIQHAESVLLPLAIESGSRAWGFPSPDSDYDCRFIFLRRTDDYLMLFPKRDVIETPIEDEFDVNGWDLGKALRLLLKGNAVVVEWLTSPIIYRGDAQFRDEILALAHRVVDRSMIARHYLHLGERQRRAYFADGKSIQLKKIFYALRPAVALRWLRLHPEMAIAPMHFPTLLAESLPPADVTNVVVQLIARKSVTRELGIGELPDPVRVFIDEEYAVAHVEWDAVQPVPRAAASHDAQHFFRSTLTRLNG